MDIEVEQMGGQEEESKNSGTFTGGALGGGDKKKS